VGLRLALRKAQSEAGDIVLLFADESEALTHPYLARAWAKRGADLRVPAPGQAKKVAMIGAFDHAARRLVVHTGKTKRSADFIALLEMLDALYGPKPGLRMKPVVIVLDNGPIHVSKAAGAALAARAHWLTVEWLPKYAPELNDIEIVWRDLKVASSRPPDFHRRRAPRPRHPHRRNRLERRANRRSVGQTKNLCLACVARCCCP
jgi:transposase